MRRRWSGVIWLIAIIAGLGAGIWDKFVLGRGWIPAMILMVLFLLAIPVITGVVWEAARRLMEWREVTLRSATMEGGHRPMTSPPPFPPPGPVGEVPGGDSGGDAGGRQLWTFFCRRGAPDVARQ